MLAKKLPIIVFLFVYVVLTGCRAQAASVAQPEPVTKSEAAGVIVVSDISDEPSKEINRLLPLADILAANLTGYGIGVGDVKIAPDMETMIKWMKAGEVDLYMDSPYPAMMISDGSGAEPLLRRWKSGVAEYKSVIFAFKESGLTSLNDLNGQMVAFEEPFSTSGYMMPLALLVEAGLNPVKKESPEAAVAADEVGYIFSGEDENSIQLILGGKVPVAVLDNVTFGELPEETRQQLVILAESEMVPRQVVMVRPNMEPELKEAISQILMGLDDSEEGQVILETLKKTDRFDPFPGGPEAAFDRMRELYRLTRPE